MVYRVYKTKKYDEGLKNPLRRAAIIHARARDLYEYIRFMERLGMFVIIPMHVAHEKDNPMFTLPTDFMLTHA